jgi:hypothetical protein
MAAGATTLNFPAAVPALAAESYATRVPPRTIPAFTVTFGWPENSLRKASRTRADS